MTAFSLPPTIRRQHANSRRIWPVFRISLMILTGIALFSVVSGGQAAQASAPVLWGELNPAQRKIVQEGGRVMITTSVPGQPWPLVRVYQIVAVHPEQITAVFFDYNAADTYVPHLQESTIIKKIDARTQDVDYRLTIPPLPEERYTVRNTLHPVEKGLYEIDWKLLRATSTRASEGNFRVQAFGKQASIFCYSNLVVPGTRLAIVLRGLALEQVQKNIDALIQQVEKQIQQNPKSLERQIEALRTALSEPSPNP